MTIPLFTVYMAPEAAEMVTSTLASGYIGEGPRVAEFEQSFGELIGSPVRPLATNSCTSAIDLALHLCGVGQGSVVISTPMTCTATNTMIVNRGARILWADVDPLTGLIDPASVGRLMEWCTAPARRRWGGNVPGATLPPKAIISVDWGGRLCDYDALHEIAPGYYPWIIQDAAHSILATDRDGEPGALGGDFVCYSFQAIKHLTTGDGGALIVPESRSFNVNYDRARLLRWYGLDRLSSASFRCDQRIEEAGYKYHMNDIAASIGLANLPHVEWVVERHRENARFYHEALADIPGVTLPPPDEGSSWWLYTILVDDRDDFIAYAAEQGVECSPVHSRNDIHPAFQRACLNPNDPLPGVDAFASREVAIPVHWELNEPTRRVIASVVRTWALVHAGRDVKAEAMEQFA